MTTSKTKSQKENSQNSSKKPDRKKSKSKATTEPHKKSSGKRRLGENSTKPTKIRKKAEKDPLLNKEREFKLKRVLLGHGHLNPSAVLSEEGESLTDIWACQFEPAQLDKPNPLVAIASSYTLLFLDTQQGRITKKYTHTETQEVFYSLDWTVLRTGSKTLKGHEDCTLLAAAGRLGSIKLFNPLQNQCYRYLFGHSKSVMKLAFSKKEPRWLYSASADNTVRLWDIGSPTSETDDSVCLAKFNVTGATGFPSAVSFSYDLSVLVVGSDAGDLVQFKLTKKDIQNLKNIKGDHDEDAFTPAINFSPNVVYPGGDEWHEGYVDDVYIMGQNGDNSDPLNNMIVSRGSEDYEIIVWDPTKSTKKDSEILKSLEWPESDESTGLRMKVYEKKDEKILVAGDYDGEIKVFNIGDGKRSKLLDDNSLEQFKPDNILKDPQSSALIRDVCYSSELRTLVAVNAENHIFIWTCDNTI
ncbi:WD40 repeat-like protein [Backusella circina FSU 941]|nr:WD40 repeat-like protein [Backusella circina FSU 941]KAI8889402.1 WD40 repeat-like protein [Backusella circina FSU 941]